MTNVATNALSFGIHGKDTQVGIVLSEQSGQFLGVRMMGYLAARPATRALVWNRRAHKSYPRLHRGSLASLSMVKQSENLVP